MANTLLTHQMVARKAAAMLEASCPFVSNINRDREDEFASNVGGYTRGDTVKVRIQPASKVFDGPNFAGGGAAPGQTESYVNLTVDTQKHVALTFGAKEKKLDLTDYSERILRPAMETLANFVNADLLGRAVRDTPRLVGTPGTIPADYKVLGQAKASLDRALAPNTQRYGCISSDANAELTSKFTTLFNPQKVISEQWKSGLIGDNNGIEWYTDQGLPTVSNGSNVTGLTVSGANQKGKALVVAGLTAGDTILKGTVFTIANVKEVSPILGNQITYSANNRQFVVTQDFTATGATGTIQIYPAITLDAVDGVPTVNVLPANAAPLTFVGAAGASARQGLVFNRDAFAAAFVPLPILASCEGYTASLKNGVAVRVMTFGNGQTDVESTRIDVLYGYTAVRADHAVRITE